MIDDHRPTHDPLPLAFAGTLSPLQETALAAVLANDDGVLVAPPGTGKTVIACAAIAARQLPTLVLAHSKPLLEQWRAQLRALLGLHSKQIGQAASSSTPDGSYAQKKEDQQLLTSRMLDL